MNAALTLQQPFLLWRTGWLALHVLMLFCRDWLVVCDCATLRDIDVIGVDFHCIALVAVYTVYVYAFLLLVNR